MSLKEFTCDSRCDSTQPSCCFKDGERYVWLGYVGSDAVAAKAIILKQNKDVEVVILGPGSAFPSDFCCNRVILHIDGQGKVLNVPSIG